MYKHMKLEASQIKRSYFFCVGETEFYTDGQSKK